MPFLQQAPDNTPTLVPLTGQLQPPSAEVYSPLGGPPIKQIRFQVATLSAPYH
jgi:hypothetical protein